MQIKNTRYWKFTILGFFKLRLKGSEDASKRFDKFNIYVNRKIQNSKRRTKKKTGVSYHEKKYLMHFNSFLSSILKAKFNFDYKIL
jgi:hypothetical protein